MYGAYWCPHCAHQKELFGAEAWSLIPYVECSLKGFYYDNSKVENIFSKIDKFNMAYHAIPKDDTRQLSQNTSH